MIPFRSSRVPSPLRRPIDGDGVAGRGPTGVLDHRRHGPPLPRHCPGNPSSDSILWVFGTVIEIFGNFAMKFVAPLPPLPSAWPRNRDPNPCLVVPTCPCDCLGRISSNPPYPSPHPPPRIQPNYRTRCGGRVFLRPRGGGGGRPSQLGVSLQPPPHDYVSIFDKDDIDRGGLPDQLVQTTVIFGAPGPVF